MISKLALLAVVVVIPVGLVLARRWQRLRNTAPACGRCGYFVRGLPTFLCPECGSDIREVGVLLPGWRKPMSRSQQAAVWTCIVVFTALVSTRYLIDFLPKIRHESQDSNNLRPASGAYRRLSIVTFGTGYGQKVRPQKVTLDVTPLQGKFGVLSVDLDEMSYQRRDDKLNIIESGRPLTFEHVLAWLTPGAPNPSDPALHAEAKELMRILEALRTGTPLQQIQFTGFTGNGAGMSASYTAPAWGHLAAVLMWAVILIAGFCWIIRKPRTTGLSPAVP